MKERASWPMKAFEVRAILDGTKTQTRRVLKPQPNVTHDGEPYWHIGGYRAWEFRGITDPLRSGTHNPIRCKFGQPGDRLWVRESFADLLGTGIEHRPKRNSEIQRFAYSADTRPNSHGDDARKQYGVKWKPSMYMPRWASRIDLLIKSVRVERLQDISEADATKEGCGKLKPFSDHWQHRDVAKEEFRMAWEHINGPSSWDANPWVWVIEFERVEK